MKKPYLEIILVIVIILVLVGIAVTLANEIKRPIRLPPPPRRAPWTVNELPRIQPWLTFDYLNHVFRLPPTYLANKLPKPDAHYPNISIERYTDRHGLNQAQFLNAIKVDIQDYLKTATST
ncbi:MAG: hypothetical protein WC640_02770 [Candidatus Paceibacterota bacterium]|jgi:hypothetical protein